MSRPILGSLICHPWHTGVLRPAVDIVRGMCRIYLPSTARSCPILSRDHPYFLQNDPRRSNIVAINSSFGDIYSSTYVRSRRNKEHISRKQYWHEREEPDEGHPVIVNLERSNSRNAWGSFSLRREGEYVDRSLHVYRYIHDTYCKDIL